MNAIDRSMLIFANRWIPYGGGDEHIFTEFGLSAPRFYRKVLGLIESGETAELSPSDRENVRLMCTRKLAQRRTST